MKLVVLIIASLAVFCSPCTAEVPSSAFTYTGLTAAKLEGVVLPSANDYDTPNTWSPAAAPDGKKFVEIVLDLKVTWEPQKGPLWISYPDLKLGPDASQIKVVASSNDLGSYFPIGDKPNRNAPVVHISSDINNKAATCNAKAHVLLLVPEDLTTISARIGETSFQTELAKSPRKIDLKSCFAFTVGEVKLVASAGSGDDIVTNPEGKILIVQVKRKLLKTNIITDTATPSSVHFADDWLNVRVGDKLFPNGGGYAINAATKKPEVRSRNSRGKNTAVTGGTQSPTFVSDDKYIFLVPAGTKQFDLLLLGHVVVPGVKVP